MRQMYLYDFVYLRLVLIRQIGAVFWKIEIK